MHTQSSNLKPKSEPVKLTWRWVTSIFVAWLALGIAPQWLSSKPSEFADMFGMVNSLFSAAAFLGLIYTINLQMHELGLQREELEQTRGELANSTAAQRDSAQALAVQIVMGSITAQISTLTHISRQYKESIAALKKEMPIMVNSEGAAQKKRELQRGVDDCINEMNRLQKEIDALHNRLVQYDKTWSAKLIAK